MSDWKMSIEHVASKLEELDEEREKLLRVTRELTRLAREVVFKIHSGKLGEAEPLISSMNEKKSVIDGYREKYPMLYYSGSVNNALTEYVEAVALYRIVAGKSIPAFTELEVTPSSYLAGLGDVVGELRRHALNLVREERLEEAWSMLRLMEEIYVEISKLSFPEALIPGVRHKMDVARVLLENTRKDLVFYEKSSKLVEKLEAAIRACGKVEVQG